ncbi:UDP-2,4-diacetamido-2,4,6-trideoxy-beta-L-altropyranose hydrolase [Methylomonas sp. EFPC3]|uniref:UDP-2,4-diacetamido-2,4, 6-trideoxy-beta-L-altropyranose hydrolase n=1 Tax=Methylomonas sp. EFPC3 TaxID=3021710 RepID=UPI0024168C14|nr:UDP-2,4-diacetamido-2,4,6-trideoxy-beta-L-altropyranose hydrolase [Methylomonas sp. EFPC3]WFP50629.1 UDP-2,4-diacetamido-2,4,6-trideoxy-beta-L-altropyranose hydrolase [Methylomonas sp. EFPC3]
MSGAGTAVQGQMSLKVAIRADASVQMGSGHVMRCLTLADALRERGAEVAFISREHPGNLFSLIEASGHLLLRLPESTSAPDTRLAHAAWLGTTQTEDAQQTAAALRQFGDPDWLIVDHYAIDAEWEAILRPMVGRIMVIDDLADRRHDCELLLDQNFYISPEQRYRSWVPQSCDLLFGPEYALLRPEFLVAANFSRARDGRIRRILVFFGGSDPTGETVKALQAFDLLGWTETEIDVVVGKTNPRNPLIEALCDKYANIHFHCQTSDMAHLCATADIAIGAGGSANWERFKLGLPTMIVLTADNQCETMQALAAAGYIRLLGKADEIGPERIAEALTQISQCPTQLLEMGEKCFGLMNGYKGAQYVARILDRKQTEIE